VEHGFSSSPVLVDGKFVVFMRDLLAFDCESGKPVWTTPIVSHEGLNPGNFIHGSLAAGAIGQTKVIILGSGTIVRASDGKIIYQDTKMDTQAVPSPVVEGKTIFHMSNMNATLAIRALPDEVTDPLKLETRRIPIDTSAYPKHYLPWHLSSPLIHEGLAYLMNNAGVLTVLDVRSGEVVYQRLIDLHKPSSPKDDFLLRRLSIDFDQIYLTSKRIAELVQRCRFNLDSRGRHGFYQHLGIRKAVDEIEVRIEHVHRPETEVARVEELARRVHGEAAAARARLECARRACV
jgi:outer membrane protein assembly factor BamB